MKSPLLLSLLLCACAPSASQDSHHGGENADELDPVLPIHEVDQVPSHHDGFELESARLSGNILTVTASYGGGCEEHEFDMYWDGLIRESYPPQLGLTLIHDGNDDYCEAYITQQLRFDFSDIAEFAGDDAMIYVQGSDNGVSVTRGRVLEIVSPDAPEPKVDSFILNDIELNGSMLEIHLSYSGGCEDHEFGLQWDGLVQETYPAKTSLQITHNANGDRCEAYAEETLEFDVSTLLGDLGGAAVVYVRGSDNDVLSFNVD